MKKIFVAIVIFLLAFICLGLAIFQFGLGNLWERFYRDLRQSAPNMVHLQILNVVVVGLFMALFGILGFFQAKKKRRNRIVWSLLCFLFNLWAFIILSLLPVLNEEKTERVSP